MKNIKWNEVTWYSKLLAIILFIVLVICAFCFGVYYQKNIVSISDYKIFAFGGEIPSNWSIFHGPDQAPLSKANNGIPTMSFGSDKVVYGDGAFNQVDFNAITSTASQELLNIAKKNNFQITHEIVGGVPATVIHYPTDNGEVNKAGSGGEDYILQLTASSEAAKIYGSNVFLMRNWSLGNQGFESAFQHFLETVNFNSTL